MAESIEIAEYDEEVRYWLEQIEGAQKQHESWHERGQAVNDRYLDKGAGVSKDSTTAHKMNVLWSNTETIKPALYAKDPNPRVSRRFRDKDPVGRWGAIVLERSIAYGVDAYDTGYCTRNAIGDFLLPGRGQIWKEYKPTIVKTPKTDAEGKPIKDEYNEALEWERVGTRHIHWKDFLHSPARTWDEVWWVAKAEYLSKEECEAQGVEKDILDKLSFTERQNSSTEDKGERVKKVKIWEIWCKPKNTVHFISKGCPEPVKKKTPPPLRLESFFPCPRPLTATVTTDSIIPVPLYCQYQNQAEEIDRLTDKINELTKALRAAGFFDASQPELERIFEDTGNKMYPVENWAMFLSNKGTDGSIAFFPLKDIVLALEQAYIARDQAKAVMYEITGISDIVRGASDPGETATAQQIKSQWGGLRIRDLQKEVQRFARDGMRIEAEIIAENFQPETLRTMTNVPLLKDAAEKQALMLKQQQAMAMGQMLPPAELQKLNEPTFEEVYALLKNEKLRCYRIDIETDSTINADDAQEKQDRTEFLTAMTTMIQAWAPMVMQAPQFAPLLGEMLLFGARAFKSAETLEGAIEEAMDAMSQQALMPKPPTPEDPKVGIEKERVGLEREKMEKDDQYRRDEMQTKAQTEVAVANAARPKLEDAGMLAPLFQSLQAEMANMSAGNQQSQAQGAQFLMQGLQQGLAILAQIASAPKQINVQRDASGKIVGGSATPQLGAMQ